MDNQVEDVKRHQGQIMVRLVGMVPGAWLIYESAIDSLLDHLARELRITGPLSRSEVAEGMHVAAATVSRCRHGFSRIPENWLVRAHDYSGIPINELRRVACMERIAYPHHNTRAARMAAQPGEQHAHHARADHRVQP